MLKNCLVLAAALLSFAFAHAASAFMGPPTLSPESPVAAEIVSISIPNGYCDGVIEEPGFPQVTVAGPNIRILVASTHADDPLWCFISPRTTTFEIGGFPEGAYTVQVDRQYEGWQNVIVVETLGVFPLIVGGAIAPVSAPALNPLGLLGVGLLLLLAGGFAFRHGRPCFLVIAMAVLMPSGIRSANAGGMEGKQFIEVLVSTAPGAPTADEIVDYYRQSPLPGDPPLQALEIEDPLYATYLMPIRATGDFLERLRAAPESPRAALERYVVVAYGENANVERALSFLRADPYVQAAYIPPEASFSSVDLVDFSVDGTNPQGFGGQYGRADLNVDAAWQIAGGHALIGDVDTGLFMNHAGLRQFSGGQYVGGNFIPVASYDIGQATNFDPLNYIDANVDELNPVQVPAGGPCDVNGSGYGVPIAAGHGTHVAGLIGANSESGLGVKGTCKRCGIAMWKVTNFVCNPPDTRPYPSFNSPAIGAAIAYLSQVGAQVINLSLGNQQRPTGYCANNPMDSWCIGIDVAVSRDIAIVAASGNNRIALQFPAKDNRTIAAGGFQQNLAIWDDSPGSTTFCPQLPNLAPGVECGSDFTNIAGGPRQELMGSAKWVASTTYPGINWNEYVDCGDGFPGPGWGNGVGWCTGTSMSAPQVSGVVGLVRSINPLVPTGKPTFNPNTDPAATLRYVLASTTAEAQAGQAWTPHFGYGRPDAAAAARKMLGRVAGVTIRNRATPLFRLYSAATKDYADTTSPQGAFALMYNQKKSWQPAANAATVPGYPEFPHSPADGAVAAPRAAVYVMTTEFQPRAEWPALVPLHLMSKDFLSGLDFILVTTTPHIQQAHNDGYDLRTIQGYIFKPCSPEPQCMPPGTQKFWRACKTADNDCATFLESERGTFEANGYTTAYPAGSSKLLGYAYPSTDTDHDGLPDGFEYVVGTNPMLLNSDNDASPDAAEFPMVGVPVSDPCGGVGSAGARYCGANSIFRNGFDLP